MSFHKVGTLVTTNTEIQADYSGYPKGYPFQTFKPGMVGIVVSKKLPSVWRDNVFLQNIKFIGDNGAVWQVGLIGNQMRKIRYAQVSPELLKAARDFGDMEGLQQYRAVDALMEVLKRHATLRVIESTRVPCQSL